MATKKIKDPTRKSSNVPYIVAVILMFALGIVSVVFVEVVNPTKDNSVLITNIFQTLIVTTPGLLAFMKATETYHMVNSDLEKWIDDAVQRAFSEGEKSGAIQANKRTDMLEEKKNSIKEVKKG